MKGLLSAAPFCCASTLFAQGFAGTKMEPVARATSEAAGGLGASSILQMLLALAVVAGLVRFVLPRLAGKLNKRLATTLDSSIRIEESAAFAGGSLYIVQARRRSLLLSVSQSGVACLADITDPESEPEPKPTFLEIVEQAEGRVAAMPEPAHLDIEAALARLQRLSA